MALLGRMPGNNDFFADAMMAGEGDKKAPADFSRGAKS